jgi:hypothetical protein
MSCSIRRIRNVLFVVLVLSVAAVKEAPLHADSFGGLNCSYVYLNCQQGGYWASASGCAGTCNSDFYAACVSFCGGNSNNISYVDCFDETGGAAGWCQCWADLGPGC